MSAAENGNLEAIKILLDNGAKVNNRSRHFGTALDYAYEKHQYKAVRLLKEHGARRKQS